MGIADGDGCRVALQGGTRTAITNFQHKPWHHRRAQPQPVGKSGAALSFIRQFCLAVAVGGCQAGRVERPAINGF